MADSKSNPEKIASYNEDDIIVLEGLEGVRARPQMYVGDLHNAQFHILKEILDNAVDECLAGGNKMVGCIITPDYYEVFDEGRGIPVGINPNSKEKKSTLELVFTKLHAGGKLKNGAYSTGSSGCFTGDTKIKLLDGTYPTFEELYNDWQKGNREPFWVYSRNAENGKLEINKCYNVQRTKQVNKLAIIELDNGSKIKCTLDHPFMTYEGNYIEACKLKPGQSLAGLHWRLDNYGYEVCSYYKSAKTENRFRKQEKHNGFGIWTAHRVWEALGRERTIGKHIHHINHNKLDNRPENLEELSRSEHFWKDQNEHNAHYNFHNHLNQDNRSIMTKLNQERGMSKYACRQKWFLCGARAILEYGSINKESYNKCRGWCFPKYETVTFYMSHSELVQESLKYLERNSSEKERKRILSYKLEEDYDNNPVANILNHQVISVSIIDCKPTWVYGMSVENDHNYLLEAGVFVKNTHGVGSSCTNALSSYFQVWTYRDKKWWTQSYAKGKPTSKVVEGKPEGNYKKGTVVRFTPDSSILKNKLDIKALVTWVRNSSFLNPGVNFFLRIGDKEHTYNSNGLGDYIEYITKDLEVESLYKPFIMKTENVDVALQWFETDDSSLNSWCNSSPTIEGGTHLKGLITVISKGFEQFAKKKLYKAEDLRTGLYGAINIRISGPEFDSQTKEKLMNAEAEKMVIEQIGKEFEKYLSSNKTFVNKILNRANEMRALLNKFSQEKKALSKLKVRGKVSLPPAEKFISCNCKDAETRELYIVEGMSAAGTARMARNPYNQEILKLRGKIMNVERVNLAKAYESEDVLNVLKAIGFDPSNKERDRRVGKVILLCDADDDGYHISVLLLILFQKLYPELLSEGRVYTVNAPLFVGRSKTTEYYGESLKDLQKQFKGKFESVTRIKGWGECDAALLRKFAFEPTTRKLQKINSVSGNDLKYFHKIVGNDVTVRKELLSSAKQ